mmetsp:Transcript_66061/g.166551  ORF Transcript_66061/g.166551 Transcript_66061/m.166551 type:complete len:213 (+) Transcript_66061:1936-2574(+)
MPTTKPRTGAPSSTRACASSFERGAMRLRPMRHLSGSAAVTKTRTSVPTCSPNSAGAVLRGNQPFVGAPIPTRKPAGSSATTRPCNSKPACTSCHCSHRRRPARLKAELTKVAVSESVSPSAMLVSTSASSSSTWKATFSEANAFVDVVRGTWCCFSGSCSHGGDKPEGLTTCSQDTFIVEPPSCTSNPPSLWVADTTAPGPCSVSTMSPTS